MHVETKSESEEWSSWWTRSCTSWAALQCCNHAMQYRSVLLSGNLHNPWLSRWDRHCFLMLLWLSVKPSETAHTHTKVTFRITFEEIHIPRWNASTVKSRFVAILLYGLYCRQVADCQDMSCHCDISNLKRQTVLLNHLQQAEDLHQYVIKTQNPVQKAYLHTEVTPRVVQKAQCFAGSCAWKMVWGEQWQEAWLRYLLLWKTTCTSILICFRLV